jgi:uncharacterized membrane protein HdeD (DUF308 family)
MNDPNAHAAPRLLLAFFAATAGMVGVVVLALRADSDWADAGAVVVLLGVVGLLLAEIMRELRDDGDADP